MWRKRLDEAVAGRFTASGAGVTQPLGSGDHETLWVNAPLAGAVCPAGFLAPDEGTDRDGFNETATTGARAIALATLREGVAGQRQDRSSAVDRIRSTLEDPTALRPTLARYVADLDRAALATVVAAASSWLLDAQALGSRHGEPEWHQSANLNHKIRAPAAKLAATIDAVRRSPDGEDLLVIGLRRSPTDARRARRTALVQALVAGSVPTSVVVGHRESMERDRHLVTSGSMESAVDEAVDDIGWAQQTSTAPAVPGKACGYCTRLGDCPEGLAHVATQWRAPFPPGRDGPQAAAQPGSGADPTM